MAHADSEKSKTNFDIKDGKGKTVNATIDIIDKTGKLIPKDQLQKGLYDLNLAFISGPVTKIKINDANLDVNSSALINVDDVPENKTKFKEIFAIDPTAINFTNATVTVSAKGNKLFKCADWNFNTQECPSGKWKKVMNIIPGKRGGQTPRKNIRERFIISRR